LQNFVNEIPNEDPPVREEILCGGIVGNRVEDVEPNGDPSVKDSPTLKSVRV